MTVVRRAVFLADVLRAVGVEVVEYDGWQSRGAAFTDLTAVVWHHDASPVGDSPGVPAYMLRQHKAGAASAQVWVSRAGVWHLLAGGVAFHAGSVLPGMPGNYASLGIETDHTTGEDWPVALLDSLRRGTAAILLALGVSADGLHFHKTICSPVGRKTDPDGLTLSVERQHVLALLTPPPATSEDAVLTYLFDDGTRTFLREGNVTIHVPTGPDVEVYRAQGVPHYGRLSVEMTERLILASDNT